MYDKNEASKISHICLGVFFVRNLMKSQSTKGFLIYLVNFIVLKFFS